MGVAEKTPAVVRFGAYEADLRAGELRRSGLRIKLQEQPFRVLAILLERPGEVVTREELRAQLWPSDTFVDFDNSLNTDINKLREALADSALHPRYVETLPRRGYRFIAPVNLGLQPLSSRRVEEVGTEGNTANQTGVGREEEAEPELPVRLSRWQRSDMALAAAGCVAVLVFFALFNRVTPYHYVKFLPEKQAIASAQRALKDLGFEGQVRTARPLATVMDYPWLAMHTDRKWLDAEMQRSASGWAVGVEIPGGRRSWGEPLTDGQSWIVYQDGKVALLFTDVRPPAFPADLRPEELRRRITDFARESSGRIEPDMEFRPGSTSVLFVRKASPSLPQVSLNAGIWDGVNFSMAFRRWNMAGTGGSDWREWKHGPRMILTTVCALVVALYFLRRLHRQPVRPRLAILAAAILVLVFTGPRRIVEDAVIDASPRWLVFLWEGWTQSAFEQWKPIVSVLLSWSLILVLAVIAYCSLAVVDYYGRAGDPMRTRSLRAHFEGWRGVAGIAVVRGTLLGLHLAALFVLLLAATAWTRSVFPGNEWLSTLLYTGFYWKPVPMSGSTVAWRLLSIAALEAALLLLVVALPASLAAKAGASEKPIIAIGIAFWMLLQFSLSGLTTHDPAFAMVGITLQSTAVVLIYWRYDLLTAMAAVFTAEIVTMGHGAYQVFHALGASYYILPLVLWLLVVAGGVLAALSAQIRDGMRRVAKAFE